MQLHNDIDYEFETTGLARIGAGIAQVALQIFERCAGPQGGRDFAVQFMRSDCAVFGSTNRITWRPESGWSISESHCTPDFIERFKVLNLNNLPIDDIDID